MKKKRERLDIIHDILAVVNTKGSVGPTRLLQLSNLSPQMFRDYLEELLEGGLLSESKDGSRRTFSLTEKGFLFLERYKVFSNFVDELGL